MELTSPEVELYFKNGGKTAFLPAGSVEMHGPHMPNGTDTIIARAFALRMAQATDGLVLPELSYSWAGATEGFAGTISLPPEMIMQQVTWIAEKCMKMGFQRFVIVNVHGGSDAPMTLCVRRLYETHGIVAQYLNPFRETPPEAAKLFEGKHAVGMEASVLLAALDILGQPKLYIEKEIAYDAPLPPLLLAANMGFMGATGFYYQDLRHHAQPTRHTSKARGLQFIDLQVKACTTSVQNLDRYTKLARRQKNQGWFRAEFSSS